MRRAIGQTEGRGEAFARARAQRHEPGTKGSPDGCRRRARAATRTGARWKQSYGELAGKWRGWGGSMGRGERNRRGPVTIWSPETRRRRGPRRSARVLRRQLARAQERERGGSRGSPSGAHGGPWGFSSCRGAAGVGEERRRSLLEQRRKMAASGRCGGSGLQRVAPVEAADDGGPWRHRGAARWARWPWLGRSHGGGGARMRRGRRGSGAVDLRGKGEA